MSTKQALLAMLEESRGDTISGEAVATKLGVSRAAVWKAVRSLEEDGLRVESLPGSGYRLHKSSDLLSEQAIRALISNIDTPIKVLDSTESTNLVAKRWAIEGAPHGSLVVAVQQQAGRGRLGRSYTSPPGGIYMSVVLRPTAGVAASVLITAAAAVATCDAVADLCGLQLGIKWVNDLFYRGKKCCGILTEAGTGFENNSIEYMVVGIGINYAFSPDIFSPEVEAVATSLYLNGEGPVPRAALVAGVYTRLLAAAEQLDERVFLEEYKRRSVVLGKNVTVMAKEPYIAKVLDIDDDAHLIVEENDGKIAVLSAGEISIKL